MELSRREKRAPKNSSSPIKRKLVGAKNAVGENPKITAGIAVGVVAVLGAGIFLPSLGTTSINDTPSVSKWVHIEGMETVDGFSEALPRTDFGSSPLATKQSIGSVTKDGGKCSFNGQVSYLSSHNAGRGDKYLTENYLYTLAEGNMVALTDVETTKMKASKGKFEALEASYKYEMATIDPETEEETKTEKFRSVAVRAFDSVVDIEGMETPEQGMYGNDPKKGLPVVMMTYECDTPEDFDKADWKKMINAVTVSLDAKEEPKFDVVENEGEAEGLPERGVEPVIEDATDTIVPDRSGDNMEPYVIPNEAQTEGPMEFVDNGQTSDELSGEATEEEIELAVPPADVPEEE